MARYETAFRLKVFKSFLAFDGGAKLLARRRIAQLHLLSCEVQLRHRPAFC